MAGSLGSGGLMPPVRGSRTRYFLQPRDNGSKSLKPGDLGSLRLNVVYTEDHVFSSDYYSPLRDLLLKSADVEVPAWPPHGPARLHPAPGSLPPPPPLSLDLPACLVLRTVCVSLYWGWGPHSPQESHGSPIAHTGAMGTPHPPWEPQESYTPHKSHRNPHTTTGEPWEPPHPHTRALGTPPPHM